MAKIKPHDYVSVVDGVHGTTITSGTLPCPHKKGWYDSIKRWWGRQRVFVCEDCMTILDNKRKKRV